MPDRNSNPAPNAGAHEKAFSPPSLEEALAGLQMPLEEAMLTQRSIRRLRPDPVDDVILLKLVELATKAPTGSNAQNWEFVAVKDRGKKQRIGELYARAWSLYGSIGRRVRRDERTAKIMRAVEYQIKHFADVPVVMVVCARGWRLPFIVPQPSVAYSTFYGSIYPAVQNFLLAARAIGLGAGIVTLPLWNKWAIKHALKLPVSVEPVCLVPLGWPRGRYGPTSRKPASEVLHIDTYGNRLSTAGLDSVSTV